MTRTISNRIKVITNRLQKVGHIDYSREKEGLITVMYPNITVTFTSTFYVDRVSFNACDFVYSADFTESVADKDVLDFALDVLGV